MAEKGPFLTSCIIFYLSIGAAIFQILEEPNWQSARDRYTLQKENIVKKYKCLTKADLDEILETVSEAAGQGVTIVGDIHHNTWDWANSVIFASTIVTTIGFGNVAPKTKSGRVFCILYGLCGIPLCLVWISELGSFFGDRAKRLSGILIRKGVSVKRVQLTCTALFLLWGLLVHLVLPPVVFMYMEGWSYLEGLYYSFITLTTVGFGDYVAGVNPKMNYPRLYRTFAELWIYMGLAWLSLFFSWNVNMVVEAHKVLKKRRRQRHRHFYQEEPKPPEDKDTQGVNPDVIDIFNFPKGVDYSTIIKQIGAAAQETKSKDNMNRSKSCSDIVSTNILTLDHSPRHRRLISVSEVFMSSVTPKREEKEEDGLTSVSSGTTETTECSRTEHEEHKEGGASEDGGSPVGLAAPPKEAREDRSVQRSNGKALRFQIYKVTEEDLIKSKDDKRKEPDEEDQR